MRPRSVRSGRLYSDSRALPHHLRIRLVGSAGSGRAVPDGFTHHVADGLLLQCAAARV